MCKKIILILITFSVFSLSNAENTKWQKINIETDNQNIILYSNNDTLSYEKHIRSFDNYEEGTIIDSAIYISKMVNREDRDSIFRLSKAIIDKAFIPQAICSDCVGKLKIIITYSEKFSVSCEYNAVCDWKNMSEETKRLYKFMSYTIEELK
jgi:hypothetical protein